MLIFQVLRSHGVPASKHKTLTPGTQLHLVLWWCRGFPGVDPRKVFPQESCSQTSAISNRNFFPSHVFFPSFHLPRQILTTVVAATHHTSHGRTWHDLVMAAESDALSSCRSCGISAARYTLPSSGVRSLFERQSHDIGDTSATQIDS